MYAFNLAEVKSIHQIHEFDNSAKQFFSLNITIDTFV